MTTENQNQTENNQNIVEPQNSENMITANQNSNPQNVETMETTQILTDEQMNNLLWKLDNHFAFEGNNIYDTLNNLTFVVEDAQEKVKVKDPNDESNSFKVEKRLLESDEIKSKKATKLAQKVERMVTHSITGAKKSEQIQADCDTIETNIKSKFNNLGKFQSVDHVTENKFVAKYESGNAYIEKDETSGEFTIASVHQIKNEKLNVK